MNTRIYINALGCILNVVSYGLAKELFVRQPQYAQLGCLLERKGERGYGNLEQHGHYSPMTGGPPLPEKKKKKKESFSISCTHGHGAATDETLHNKSQITGSGNKRRHCFFQQNTKLYMDTPHNTTKMSNSEARHRSWYFISFFLSMHIQLH